MNSALSNPSDSDQTADATVDHVHVGFDTSSRWKAPPHMPTRRGLPGPHNAQAGAPPVPSRSQTRRPMPSQELRSPLRPAKSLVVPARSDDSATDLTTRAPLQISMVHATTLTAAHPLHACFEATTTCSEQAGSFQRRSMKFPASGRRYLMSSTPYQVARWCITPNN